METTAGAVPALQKCLSESVSHRKGAAKASRTGAGTAGDLGLVETLPCP